MPPQGKHQQGGRVALRNHQTLETLDDRLHRNLQNKVSSEDGPCPNEICLGSVIMPISGQNDEFRNKDEVKEQAKDFLNQYFASIKG
jgi:hypothetical protein